MAAVPSRNQLRSAREDTRLYNLNQNPTRALRLMIVHRNNLRLRATILRVVLHRKNRAAGAQTRAEQNS